MAEATGRIAPHRSIFVRLVTIMVVMAACMVAMVGGFYYLIVIPGIHTSMDRLVGRHTRMIAESHPTRAQALELARKLDFEVRYEGPDSTWTTSESVPTRARLQHAWPRSPFAHFLLPRHNYYIVLTPQGSYTFERTFSDRFRSAHSHMLVMLLILMVGVFASAYLVMRNALRPLRMLEAAVHQVGEGKLDVVVPRQSQDEFGVLTDAFNLMARRVKAMIHSRDQLLLDVSHELRSPLTRMKVALAILPETPQRQSMIADVAEMETMISEMLELERLRGGHGIQTSRTDLVPLVRDVVERHADREPGVRLASAPAGAWVEADRERVRTVLRNLLENAIKFSLPDSRPVEVAVTDEPDGVRIRVSDDGPGIPEGAADTLFEPFYRLDSSRSKKTGGYGLGLSICRRIMEAHGGTITIEPRSGRGATFVLTFRREA